MPCKFTVFEENTFSYSTIMVSVTKSQIDANQFKKEYSFEVTFICCVL